MAKILIVGGSFGGVVAAESLARKLECEHQIVMVSRSRKFLFYPALVRLAFGRGEPDDVSFDLREAMLDRRVTFIEGEIARIHPGERRVTVARGEFTGQMHYDYLVFALGRRLATERIAGFFEYAHHTLDLDGAFKFGEALRNFEHGHVVLGYCPGARLPVPLFETAFALSRLIDGRKGSGRSVITIVSSETPEEMFGDAAVGSETPEEMFGDAAVGRALSEAMQARGIELVSDFSIERITRTSVIADDGRAINCDLAMVIPPFTGPGALLHTGITDAEGYVPVEATMRVPGVERMYAVGDCVSLPGPKMGHMAVRQGEVAAENLAAEVQGRATSAAYDHELTLVLETDGKDSIYLHKDLGTDEPAKIKHGRFWAWAKRGHEQYWMRRHA
jgi:sulfide:quinone oxidoreductase